MRWRWGAVTVSTPQVQARSPLFMAPSLLPRSCLSRECNEPRAASASDRRSGADASRGHSRRHHAATVSLQAQPTGIASDSRPFAVAQGPRARWSPARRLQRGHATPCHQSRRSRRRAPLHSVADCACTPWTSARVRVGGTLRPECARRGQLAAPRAYTLSTFAALGLIMGDRRAVAMAYSWLGAQANIAIDANIHFIKAWTVVNIIGSAGFVTLWISVSLDLIDEVATHVLLHVNGHELLANDYATAGLVSITALITRNLYRKRFVFYKNVDTTLLECVSYRTDLTYTPHSSVKVGNCGGDNAWKSPTPRHGNRHSLAQVGWQTEAGISSTPGICQHTANKTSTNTPVVAP
ncbi:hypothetical protein PybrP1_000675, partial [[Pythium] brassicae (nom. inval.)]